ncbi:MAG: hypothetical protein CSA35_03990 [Dethiosulfovibrio peptidovorans]|nr:MAG: hypothetical protein CSA35_03990 [Dethiosulfovibrio peptidovorans]
MIHRFSQVLKGTVLLWIVSLLMASPLWASRWPLAVTHPCLSSLVAFIGGANIVVQPLARWDRGRLVRLHPDFQGLSALALDRRDAAVYGLDQNADVVITLYRDFPVDRPIEEVFSDPATLPFLGQRVLGAISGLDPDEYEYYQRRLAEFQSRLDSTVSMGRRILKGARILIFSETLEPLFVAAGCNVTLPSEDLLLALQSALKPQSGLTEKKLIDLLNRWSQDMDAVVVGQEMNGKILKLIPELPKWIVAVPLDESVDPLVVLYDRYLAVWNVLRSDQARKR